MIWLVFQKDMMYLGFVLNNKINMNKKTATFIYTNLSDIKKELEIRRSDKNLKDKVLKFWGEHPFPLDFNEPKAILSRDIATPNMEVAYFLDVIKELNLNPLFLELHQDKFVSKNKSKYHLGMLGFRQKKQKDLILKSIINFNKQEGKMICEIPTISGCGLVSFHHKMLNGEYPECSNSTFDFSDWFLKTRYLTDDYYLYFLSLFICNGVLFDNYLLNDKEEVDFYLKKVEPSFKKAEQIFGVRPLIYPLLPIEFEEDIYWYSYPEHLLNKYL